MCMVFLVVVVVYSVYSFYYFCNAMVAYKIDQGWWSSIKDHRLDVILKFRSNGAVHIDKWGQIGLGYVAFILFGTGTDAHNTYKKMLLAVGLGKVFPSLYVMRESSNSTPRSFVSARTWTTSCVSKAKSYFSKGGSRMSSFGGSTFSKSTRNDSVAMDTINTAALGSVSSTTPVLAERSEPSNPPLLKRLFTRSSRQQPILPVFSHRPTSFTKEGEEAASETVINGFSARAWASEAPMSRRNSEPAGVIVFREVHLDEEARESVERKSADEWMLRP